MKRWIAAGLLLLGLGVALGWGWAKTAPQSAPRATKQHAEDEDRASARPLTNRSRASAQLADALALAAQNTAPEASEEPEQPPELTEEEREAKVRAVRAAKFAELDELLVQQGRDVAWEEATTDDVRQATTATGDGLRLTETVCGAELCRSTLEHDAVKPHPGLVNRVVRNLKGRYQGNLKYEAGRVYLYTRRKPDRVAHPSEDG